MQRLIASSLLVAFLAGIFAPAAMALSQDPSHACCLRKASHCHEGAQAEPSLSSGGCAQHSCCRSLAVRQWAQPALPLKLTEKTSSELKTSPSKHRIEIAEVAESHSGRAPPTSPII
jgi:hypothetical protein